MYIRKIVYIPLTLIGLVYTQSIYNAYGLGLSRTSFNTAVSGAGSIGLVPTFHPGVSMENSATWPGLNFSYINSSFGNQLFGNEINDSKNQSAGFTNIQFIVPIGERFGFGLSLKPINDHNSFFKTDTTKFSPLFVVTLSWHLASMLAGPIIKGDQGMAQAKRCAEIMQGYLITAKQQDSLHRDITVEHIVPWTSGR